MKRNFNEKIRLVLTVAVCVLFIAVAFSSAAGKLTSERNSVTEIKERGEAITKPSVPRPFRPLPLPPWFYKIVNDDWNYWTNPPHMYAIPNGNVGIGTTSPEEKLDVVGTIQMIGFKMSSGASEDYVLTSDASGIGTWQEAAGGIGGSGIANYIPKFTAPNTLGDSVIYQSSGNNVGIGTTNPGARKLKVVGDIEATGTIYGNGSGLTGILGDNLGNHIATQNINLNGNYLSGDGDNEGIYVKNDGNVGVGTVNPQGKLDIAGGALALDGNPGSIGQVLASQGSGAVPIWMEVPVGGYDAVVAPSGGDYTTVGGALADGNKKIYVKAGNYSEVQWTLDSDGTTIFGERRGAVNITFSDLNKAIQIKADNIHLENLVLRGSGTAATDYLIYCDFKKENFVIVECDLENIKHQFIYADYSTVRLYGCKLDGTGGADWGLFRDFWRNSVVEGCELIADESDVPLWYYTGGIISGCKITANRTWIGMDYLGGFVTGCRFDVRTLTISNGCYTDNSIYGNLDPGTNAVVALQGVCRFSGNRVYSSYYAKKIFSVENHLSIVNDNYFDSGKDIEIDNKYVQFCNNIWAGSQGVSQQMTITLTSDCTYSQINENIIIGKSGYVPVITDNGTNNNKLNNILTTY